MKRDGMIALMASLVFSGASHLLAQEPAPYLRIIREDIKQGKGAAHEKSEMGYVRALSKAHYPNYFALESETGPNYVWFLERYQDFAAIEAADKLTRAEPLKTTMAQLDETDGALRTGGSTMIARYLPNVSYTPVPATIAKYRYVRVNVIRIHTGRQADFGETRKMLNEAWEKAGSKQRRVIYVVLYGAPTGTYLVIQGMESLKALNGGGTAGLPDGYEKLLQEVVTSSEATLFAVNPKMSNPPQSYVEENPEFWAPKPALPKKTTK